MHAHLPGFCQFYLFVIIILFSYYYYYSASFIIYFCISEWMFLIDLWHIINVIEYIVHGSKNGLL